MVLTQKNNIQGFSHKSLEMRMPLTVDLLFYADTTSAMTLYVSKSPDRMWLNFID